MRMNDAYIRDVQTDGHLQNIKCYLSRSLTYKATTHPTNLHDMHFIRTVIFIFVLCTAGTFASSLPSKCGEENLLCGKRANNRKCCGNLKCVTQFIQWDSDGPVQVIISDKCLPLELFSWFCAVLRNTLECLRQASTYLRSFEVLMPVVSLVVSLRRPWI